MEQTGRAFALQLEFQPEHQVQERTFANVLVADTNEVPLGEYMFTHAGISAQFPFPQSELFAQLVIRLIAVDRASRLLRSLVILDEHEWIVRVLQVLVEE